MELNKTSIEKIIRGFITQFNSLSKDSEICIVPEETKIVAVCEHNVSPDSNLALLYENQKFIFLDSGFKALSTHDKLLVVAASINAHYQLTEGMITGYGEILSYELVFNRFLEQKRVLFSTSGELLEENMEQYI
jgi:hypothetical protein